MLFCKLILVAGTSPEIRFLKIWGKKKKESCTGKKETRRVSKSKALF